MASQLGSYYLDSVTRTVSEADNVNYLSIACLSGTVNVLCQAKTIASWGVNTAIPLSTGQSINVHETINIQTLDGVTIDSSSGTCGVIIG